MSFLFAELFSSTKTFTDTWLSFLDYTLYIFFWFYYYVYVLLVYYVLDVCITNVARVDIYKIILNLQNLTKFIIVYIGQHIEVQNDISFKKKQMFETLWNTIETFCRKCEKETLPKRFLIFKQLIDVRMSATVTTFGNIW